MDEIRLIFGSFGTILSLFKRRFMLGISLSLSLYVPIGRTSRDIAAFESAPCTNFMAGSAGWALLVALYPSSVPACSTNRRTRMVDVEENDMRHKMVVIIRTYLSFTLVTHIARTRYTGTSRSLGAVTGSSSSRSTLRQPSSNIEKWGIGV